MVGNATQQSKQDQQPKDFEKQQSSVSNQSADNQQQQEKKQVANEQIYSSPGKQNNLEKTPQKQVKQSNSLNGSPSYGNQNGFNNRQHIKKGRYKAKGFDTKGRPRNFYNPPGKVIRGSLQPQAVDKQKYKTALCKHYLQNNECPLGHYCQFAHGEEELRQPNDPLPEDFGKTAIGAVHSNFRTIPCKFWQKTGQCKFGDRCSFYHDDNEKRSLTDPLPNVPKEMYFSPPRKTSYKTGSQISGSGSGSGSGTGKSVKWIQEQVYMIDGEPNMRTVQPFYGGDLSKFSSPPPPPIPMPMPVQMTSQNSIFDSSIYNNIA